MKERFFLRGTEKISNTGVLYFKIPIFVLVIEKIPFQLEGLYAV